MVRDKKDVNNGTRFISNMSIGADIQAATKNVIEQKIESYLYEDGYIPLERFMLRSPQISTCFLNKSAV